MIESTLYRPCVAMDFDGVVHSYTQGWQSGKIYGELDFTGFEEAWRRGYAAAIVTARDIKSVLDCLPHEWETVGDFKCEFIFWDGGKSGQEILVTNRKISAVAYPDDRGVRHKFGDSWFSTFNTIDSIRDRTI